MSNPTAVRTVLALAALLGVGCHGSSGLTAQGFFIVADADRAIETGIDLEEEVRIDAGGRVTGSCEIRDVDGVRSVAIDLFTNGSGADNQLESASITGVLGSSTIGLTARVGSDTYSNGTCAASLVAVDQHGSAVLSTEGSCVLTTSGEDTFEATVDLSVYGCRVVTE